MKYTTSHYRWSGIRSAINQDSLMIHHILLQKREVVFCAVADGIGGLDHGEEASGYCLKMLSDWFYAVCKDMILSKAPMDSIELSLQSCIKNIQLQMVDFQKHQRMDIGTTLTGLLCIGRQYLLLHIGDSKGIVLAKKSLISRICSLFRKDSSPIYIDQKTYDNIDANGNLTHCIGMAGLDRIFLFHGILLPNTLWLIGSDGIIFNENLGFIRKSFANFFNLSKDSLHIKLEALGRNAVTLGSKDNMAIVGVLVK